MKKIFLLLLIISSTTFAQSFELGEARGLFLSVGVGPKLPIGDFSATNSLGIGFDINASYTDNQFVPLFFFAKLAYQTFPGAEKMYRTTDYASFTTRELAIMPGIKFFFPPVITNEILIMPVGEVGFSFGMFNNSHVFKAASGKQNFTDIKGKFGFHLGGGFSMFFLEGMINYYFFSGNNSISFDLRIQVPIFAKI